MWEKTPFFRQTQIGVLNVLKASLRAPSRACHLDQSPAVPSQMGQMGPRFVKQSRLPNQALIVCSMFYQFYGPSTQLKRKPFVHRRYYLIRIIYVYICMYIYICVCMCVNYNALCSILTGCSNLLATYWPSFSGENRQALDLCLRPQLHQLQAILKGQDLERSIELPGMSLDPWMLEEETRKWCCG